MKSTLANEIADVSLPRPHVFILGAGASRAAALKGDRYGRILPLMRDFVDTVPLLRDELHRAAVDWEGRNFEDLYSSLVGEPEHHELCKRLEAIIFDYFSALELPAAPTIYDHLVSQPACKRCDCNFQLGGSLRG